MLGLHAGPVEEWGPQLMQLLVLTDTALLQTFLLSGVFTVTKLPYPVLGSKI